MQSRLFQWNSNLRIDLGGCVLRSQPPRTRSNPWQGSAGRIYDQGHRSYETAQLQRCTGSTLPQPSTMVHCFLRLHHLCRPSTPGPPAPTLMLVLESSLKWTSRLTSSHNGTCYEQGSLSGFPPSQALIGFVLHYCCCDHVCQPSNATEWVLFWIHTSCASNEECMLQVRTMQRIRAVRDG